MKEERPVYKAGTGGKNERGYKIKVYECFISVLSIYDMIQGCAEFIDFRI